MTIVAISRGSYSWGKEIAEKTAERLGYECIAREEIIYKASSEFDIPAIKLTRAIHDAPTVFDRLSYTKEKYITQFKTVFLKHMVKDNIVYHGLAGHFFLQDISHVLKVRIIADMKERVRLEMERTKISQKTAYNILKNDDEERRKWSMDFYGIDTADPELYDILFYIGVIRPENAVDLICSVVSRPEFKTTIGSQQQLEDLLLAAEIKSTLMGSDPLAEVSVSNGIATVKIRGVKHHESASEREVKKLLQSFQKVREIRVNVVTQTDYC